MTTADWKKFAGALAMLLISVVGYFGVDMYQDVKSLATKEDVGKIGEQHNKLVVALIPILIKHGIKSEDLLVHSAPFNLTDEDEIFLAIFTGHEKVAARIYSAVSAGESLSDAAIEQKQSVEIIQKPEDRQRVFAEFAYPLGTSSKKTGRRSEKETAYLLWNGASKFAVMVHHDIREPISVRGAGELPER